MLLATARHEENAWYFVRESNWPLRIPVDLGRAREALLTALKSEPTLHEARLRLGHVYASMGDEERALAELAAVVAPMDRKFVYLARMFEAEIYQERGDLARAQDAYEQALKAYRAQSAEVGLARVMFLRGHRNQGRSLLLDWVTDKSAPSRDPWAEYYYGFDGQLDRYRERLRATVVADEK